MDRSGLGVLYATDDSNDRLEHVKRRDIPSHLREKYWIKKVGPRKPKHRLDLVQLTLEHEIERQVVGRSRHKPGDGFRFWAHAGNYGVQSEMEWFEVTERYPSVNARDVNDFMRCMNSIPTNRKFDPSGFLNSVDFNRPSRSVQRHASDIVIQAVKDKTLKESYKPMIEKFGYGTLIIGLPLWFATPPIDPFRPENVIDDFMCRTLAGLEHLGTRWLRGKECPFGRIVVAWESSVTAMQQWLSYVDPEIYDHPVLKSLESPFKLVSLVQIATESLTKQQEENLSDVLPGLLLHVKYDQRSRIGLFKQPPTFVRELEEIAANIQKETRKRGFANVGWILKRQILKILCFIHLHGVIGFLRWVSSNLLLGRINRFAQRSRSRSLYRASLNKNKH